MSIVTLNDRAVRSVTTFGSLTTGSMVFIKKLTASSSATLSFVNGSSDVVLDSTYKEYIFTYNNIHGSAATSNFVFQTSTNGGSSYGTTLTSTFFQASHDEADSATGLSYQTSQDHAQATSFQKIGNFVGGSNDDNVCGMLQLFNPSSTTFVKHFICKFVLNNHDSYCVNPFVAGYFNTTSAINAVQFKMDSGNIDAGDICLYGIL